jgi:hypothetical protein
LASSFSPLSQRPSSPGANVIKLFTDIIYGFS